MVRQWIVTPPFAGSTPVVRPFKSQLNIYIFIIKKKITSSNKSKSFIIFNFYFSEREGFEPPVTVKPRWFSKPEHSTTLPPFHET